jgi:NADH-quinone oxidoreductase subunit H
VSGAASVLRLLSGAVVGVPAAVLGGVYAVAVLDRLIGRAVARQPLRLAEAAAAPAREAGLFFLQSRTVTERPDGALWALAPALLGSLAAAALVAIPMSPALALPDIRSGIVYFGAAMAMVMVAVYIHGWSPNSVFPMIGAYRFVAQALSYEMPLALVLIAVALPAESLSVGDIVRSQAGTWNIVRQPLGLPLYLIAGLGLAFWGPLNSPDAADLAGGTRAESSGVPYLLWSAARSAVLVAVAAMGAAAFLGGWLGPWLPGALWMVLKTLSLLVVLLATGHLVARVRLERFVVVAWTVLIPLSLVDIFVSGLLALRGAGK